MEAILLTSMEEKYRRLEANQQDIDLLLQQAITNNRQKIVVLDDDPTGVQTVHHVFVYTDWSIDSLGEGLLSEEKVFYILTNSRAFSATQTAKVHEEIAKNLLQAARETGQDFILISRGDSTLRGHYPLETAVLKQTLEGASNPVAPFHGEILCPYFKNGGRFTVEDVHYVCEDGILVPAAQTEFARDKTFSYHQSNLAEYVEEKTKGEFMAGSVMSISLKSLRNQAVKEIQDQLMSANSFQKIIVNALDDQDVKVFCLALYGALEKGRRFLFRTAASFVQMLGGISDSPLLTAADVYEEPKSSGGLVIVGSHTGKTTAQLDRLRSLTPLEFIEFKSELVLENLLEPEVDRVSKISSDLLTQGKTVVIYTGRTLLSLPEDTKETALARSTQISEGLQKIVGQLNVSPRFIIAKGGITSSDIGVKALKVRKALVLGQIQPGVPVWQLDSQSKFPGIPYVIFPGNVGDEDSLLRTVKILLDKQKG